MINYNTLLNTALEAALKAGNKTLDFYREDMTVLIKDDNSPLTRADLESNRIINEYLAGTDIPILSEENKTVPYDIRKNWNRFWLIDPLDGTKEFINKRAEYTINIALVEKAIPVLGVVYAPALDLLYFALKKQGSFKVTGTVGKKPATLKEHALKLSVGKPAEKLRVVASRSHLSGETSLFIENLKKYKPVDELNSIGSSLKLCMIAEGSAEIYPRLGPTMEWDTAASHAVVIHAGGAVIEADNFQPLTYNKINLHNPYFIVYNPELDQVVRKLISKG